MLLAWTLRMLCNIQVLPCCGSSELFSRLIVWQIVNAYFNVYKAAGLSSPPSLLKVSDFLWACFAVSPLLALKDVRRVITKSEIGPERALLSERETQTLQKRNGKCHPLLGEWIHEFPCEPAVIRFESQPPLKAKGYLFQNPRFRGDSHRKPLKQKDPNISPIVEFIRAEIFLSAALCGPERTWVCPSLSCVDTRRYLGGGRGPTFVAVTVWRLRRGCWMAPFKRWKSRRADAVKRL